MICQFHVDFENYIMVPMVYNIDMIYIYKYVYMYLPESKSFSVIDNIFLHYVALLFTTLILALAIRISEIFI